MFFGKTTPSLKPAVSNNNDEIKHHRKGVCTSWMAVMYFFHHKNFWKRGPAAERP